MHLETHSLVRSGWVERFMGGLFSQKDIELVVVEFAPNAASAIGEVSVANFLAESSDPLGGVEVVALVVVDRNDF